MHSSSPRLRRGTSVIAALIFAAILGGIALGLNAVRPQSPQSITAAVDATNDPNALTPASGAGATNNVGYTGSCTIVVQAAAAQGHESQFSPVTDSKENLKDSCNAAVFKTGPDLQAVQKANPSNWQHDQNAYQCKGKSGTLVDNSNGTFTETMHGDSSVGAGKCNTQLCDSSGKCSATQLVSGVSAVGSGTAAPFSGLPDSGSGSSPSVTSNGTLPDACKTDATSPACTAALQAQSGGTSANSVCNQLSPLYNYLECQKVTTTASQNSNNKCAFVSCLNGQVCDQLSGQCVDSISNPIIPQARPCTDQNGNTIACPTGINTGNQVNNPSGPCPTGQAVNPDGTCTLAKIAQSGPCPNGAASCSTVVTPGGFTSAPRGFGGGLGSFLNGFMHGATFGSSPTMMGGNPAQQRCSFIASIFGCQNATVACQISISPNPPQQGMPASLTWTTYGNVGFAAIPGIGQVGPSGTYTVYPGTGMNYTLQIEDQAGNQNSCSTQANAISRTGCTGNSSCQSAQTPYGVGTNGQTCGQPPAQPDPAQCTTGSWRPTSAAGNGCTTGYQCVPDGSGNGSAAPTAQLSCSPQTVEVGQPVAIAYSCGGGSTTASSSAFTTSGLSGTASIVVPVPPANTNTATYRLACTNAQGQTTGAQCSVQINQPSIVLVANPAQVPSGQTTTIGWVTAGMQSCVVSSPTDANFTSQNASNKSVNGMATTNPITGTTEYDLACTTIGGQTKTASTTVKIGTAAAHSMQVTSSADGRTVNHGSAVTIQWQSQNAPSNSAVALWLVDLHTQAASALIAGAQPASGSYQWTIPATGSSCDTSLPNACASDLVAGNSYGIEASVYQPSNAFLGGSQVPSGAVRPTYTDSGYTPNPFSIGQ